MTILILLQATIIHIEISDVALLNVPVSQIMLKPTFLRYKY